MQPQLFNSRDDIYSMNYCYKTNQKAHSVNQFYKIVFQLPLIGGSLWILELRNYKNNRHYLF